MDKAGASYQHLKVIAPSLIFDVSHHEQDCERENQVSAIENASLFILQVYLGIEFYLFVSHGGMKRQRVAGPRVNFVMREALFEIYTLVYVDPLSLHTSMRNKQVEFNPYIYTLSKLYRFGYEISIF